MIVLENLKKSFGSRQILRGLSLEIPRGETVCLIGGSGTGKSVTLKHIMRLLEPDEGKIIFDGEDISHASGRKLQNARRKLGVLFQSGALLNWLTIGENVALPLAENTSMKRAEIDKRVMETLELLQIPHARDLYPNQISGGMQKRAGLARAVVWRPPCVLYDEPTSGLDPVITALVDEMINDMKAKLGATQVIITHDMTSAYRTADRIAMLYQGQVVEYGTPDEIKNTKNPIVRQFIEGLVTGPITAGMARVDSANSSEDAGGDAAASAPTPSSSSPRSGPPPKRRASARQSARRGASGSARADKLSSIIVVTDSQSQLGEWESGEMSEDGRYMDSQSQDSQSRDSVSDMESEVSDLLSSESNVVTESRTVSQVLREIESDDEVTGQDVSFVSDSNLDAEAVSFTDSSMDDSQDESGSQVSGSGDDSRD